MAIDILCRYDAAQQSPVVFLRDTIQGDKIQVWSGHGNPKVMPLDYYKMTSPLSADDERVLSERYKAATGKQDQVVRITHRLPRTSRPLPNMLSAGAPASRLKDINEAPAHQEQAKRGSAKPIEAQAPVAPPVGDLPKAGETPAPMPQAPAEPAPLTPSTDETPSAALFRRIQELNKRMGELHQGIVTMSTELQKATTDYETAKQAAKELTAEFEQAIEKEAAEELRKRKEMVAALVAGSDPLAQAAQALHDASTQQATSAPTQAEKPAVEPEKPAAEPATQKPRGQGGRFQKAPAPGKK